MTADARAALERAGFSRRRFLKGSGALIVGFSVARLTARLGPRLTRSRHSVSTVPAAAQLDSWIAIAARRQRHGLHRQVRARPGTLHRADAAGRRRARRAARPRDARFSATPSLTPDQGTTSGSQSHPTNFNQSNLALAGATAREALVRPGLDAPRRAGRPSSPSETASSASRRPVEDGRLRRAGRRHGSSTSRSTRPRSASIRASGRCSARRCRASTCRRW